jgi:hypothetical protein
VRGNSSLLIYVPTNCGNNIYMDLAIKQCANVYACPQSSSARGWAGGVLALLLFPMVEPETVTSSSYAV